MKKCLFCAEEIQEDAIKCKHCGSDVGNEATQAKDENVSIIAFLGIVLVLINSYLYPLPNVIQSIFSGIGSSFVYLLFAWPVSFLNGKEWRRTKLQQFKYMVWIAILICIGLALYQGRIQSRLGWS